jgi:hypothetical protein
VCRLERFKSIGVYLSIGFVAIASYLPALNNSFISDDFTMFSYLHGMRQDPLYIFKIPSECFRFSSYVYFWICASVFGPRPEWFYAAGIALHVGVCILVYTLIRRLTGNATAAWAGAIFFAAYERHQEAVMWISAANSEIVTLSSLLFLCLWHRETIWSRRWSYPLLVVALFSKETAVALAPLSLMVSLFGGSSWTASIRRALPVFGITAVYIVLWTHWSSGNAFVTTNNYAFGWHFIPVYVRAIGRLLLQVVPFVVLGTLGRRNGMALPHPRGAFVVLLALLLLPALPVSFLTYLDHIPSRNTYFPSVGLAGLVGIYYSQSRQAFFSARLRTVAISFLLISTAGNATYIWVRKDQQYVDRAAPTRQLISLLNGPEIRNRKGASVCVSNFPLDSWIGQEASRWFTEFPVGNLTFSDSCQLHDHDVMLEWKDSGSAALMTFRSDESAGGTDLSANQ